MKINPEENQDPLARSLREWCVSAPLPLRFQEKVWRRVADAAREDKAAGWWTVLQNWFQLTFSRPAIAVAYALLLLFLGSGAGYWQARQKSALIEQTLGTRYVQSVDPYLKTGM